MFKLVEYFLRVIFSYYKLFLMRLRVFQIYGVFLPEGAYIANIANIKIGEKFSISKFCFLFSQDPAGKSELVIGNRVSLNCNVMINADCGGKIHIGNNVIIGPMTVLRASNHNFGNVNIPIRDQGHSAGFIVIEDDVWIGACVVILPNVTIGKGAVIGAGSIVTKSIPSMAIAVGNPARVIRFR